MKSYKNENNEILINISNSEAIVLYEYLYQVNEKMSFDNYAEKKVLLQLQGNIETKLGELFSSNYSESLECARKEVQGLDEI